MSYAAMSDDLIKVASFNLRRDFGPSRKNRWEVRRSVAANVIRDSGAAIIGVQEVLPKMRQDILKLLSGYSIFGQGRMMGQNPNSDEHSDIIIKNDDIEVSMVKTFWISKNPDTVSRAYFSIFPRICTVAEVKIKKSGQRIRVFNTHFDHVCWLARTLGVRMILDYIERANETDPLPTILMGDFNAAPSSFAVRIIREGLYDYQHVSLRDVYVDAKANLSNTYHGLKGRVKPGASPIDYIFVSEDFEVLNVKIDKANRNGVYPSDHYPVMATLRLKHAA